MGREDTIVVSLRSPHYPTRLLAGSSEAGSDHNVSAVTGAVSLWNPGPLPPHLQRRENEPEPLQNFHLLLSLMSLGLPQFCDRLLAMSTVLTDRLLAVSLHSSSARARRPLVWCAGLVRLMSDRMEAEMLRYNTTMPGVWQEVLRALASPQRGAASHERHVSALMRGTSEIIRSFGSFLKDVQEFYNSVQAELNSLESLLARQRRRRMILHFLLLIFLLILMLVLWLFFTS
ncbi:hypothetical protein KP509_10G048700 [Ceratopteris richardii]|uniref:Uncharacterized protein n=1 Tax=Ceratopteris richardii TaxID=49495 RepID=A0A8T2U4M1_CERRI|nr:hypothetical protein KP509_10G048700 [Ceratopteris richardii]